MIYLVLALQVLILAVCAAVLYYLRQPKRIVIEPLAGLPKPPVDLAMQEYIQGPGEPGKLYEPTQGWSGRA